MAALSESSSIRGQGRPVPRGIGKRQIAAGRRAVGVPRQHLAWVQVRIPLGAKAVHAPFEENELADDGEGEDDVEEDDRGHASGDLAAVLAHPAELAGGEDPGDDEGSQEDGLREEREEGCDAQALECGDWFGVQEL